MKPILSFLFAGLLCAVSLSAQARPVSYTGGTTVITTNDGDANTLMLHYTPDPKYSIGTKTEYWREKDYLFQGAQLNILAKRWNNRDSQANFYVKSGIGAAFDDDRAQGMAFTGVALDWEDRRYFTSYENRVTVAGDIDRSFMQSARVGITPYIGEYGDLHTWLMLEVRHAPESADPLTLTPMVRFFKDTHLIEAGYSNKDTFLFNWIIRY